MLIRYLRLRRVLNRKPKSDGGSCSLFRFDIDKPAMAVHQIEHDRESQSGVGVFGAEKRIKYVLPGFFRHAGAVIGNGNGDPFAGFSVQLAVLCRYLYGNVAGLMGALDRLCGILDDVADHLVNGRCVCLDGWHLRKRFGQGDAIGSVVGFGGEEIVFDNVFDVLAAHVGMIRSTIDGHVIHDF